MKRFESLLRLLPAVPLLFASCSGSAGQRPLRLVVLDPGHFHASLLQKNALAELSDTVRVYAPEGEEVEQYLAAVASYNGRAEEPTSWREVVYTGPDYLERMVGERAGDLVVLAGNNRKKTGYILASVKAGYHVLSDKPLAVCREDFDALRAAYAEAHRRGVWICDLMTERYDALNVLTRNLMHDAELFGDLLPGSADDPSISMRSIHHFFKSVSGRPLIRPAWYYDVEQQGEGIADVTTHLIDLVFWQCFPENPVRYETDVEVLAASHWPTAVRAEDFRLSTGVEPFPPYLEKYLRDGVLEVMANGRILFRVKGVHVGMEVVWNWSSPNGEEAFSSVVRGSRASIEVVQE
nr:Gfo/Idh/MocA family oxidoreductase [Alistipes sp.]